MKLSIFILLLLSLINNINGSDLVIFSCNRATQLYALLESIEHYMTGITSSKIIIKADSNRHKQAYTIVENRFAWARFIYQSNPPNDFKELVMKYSFDYEFSDYILFAVDDIIVKDYVDLNKCVDFLKTYQAYTLLLRLGKNINHCYSLNIETPMPIAIEKEQGLYQYIFSNNKGDWAYPNNLDMSLYRKKDIHLVLNKTSWNNPNQMEGAWASTANMNQCGLFFELSKIINVPLNIVGTCQANRYMHSYSEHDLLEKFEKGFRIDISYFDRIINNSAHMEYDICFK